MLNYKLSLDDYQSFRDWKDRLAENFMLLKLQFSLCHNTLDRLSNCLSTSPNIVDLFKGDGRLLVYHWGNGEMKLICEIDGQIVAEDPFWLERYPFIDMSKNGQGYYIRNDIVIDAKLSHSGSLFVPSHNLHFGHFISDDLPWIAAYSALLLSHDLITLSNCMPLFVEKELASIGIKPSTLDVKNVHSGLVAYESSELFKGYVHGWPARAY